MKPDFYYLLQIEKNGIEREKICSELMEKLHHYNLIV